MLSQKTTLIAKRYYETCNPELKKHLIELYQQMKRNHREIISTHLTSDKITAIYHQPPDNLNEKVEPFVQPDPDRYRLF